MDNALQEFVAFAKEEDLLGPKGFKRDVLKQIFNKFQKDDYRNTLTLDEFCQVVRWVSVHMHRSLTRLCNTGGA